MSENVKELKPVTNASALNREETLEILNDCKDIVETEAVLLASREELRKIIDEHKKEMEIIRNKLSKSAVQLIFGISIPVGIIAAIFTDIITGIIVWLIVCVITGIKVNKSDKKSMEQKMRHAHKNIIKIMWYLLKRNSKKYRESLMIYTEAEQSIG